MWTLPPEQRGLSVNAVRQHYLLDGWNSVSEWARRPECPGCHEVPLGRGFYNGPNGLVCNRCRGIGYRKLEFIGVLSEMRMGATFRRSARRGNRARWKRGQ